MRTFDIALAIMQTVLVGFVSLGTEVTGLCMKSRKMHLRKRKRLVIMPSFERLIKTLAATTTAAR